MNSFMNCNNKVFRIIVSLLIYCMVVFPVSGSTSWSAQAPTEGEVELSAREKQDLVQQGVDQYKQGKHDQAQKNLEKAKTVFPENYAVPYYLGLIYLEQGKRTAAIAQWQQYVKMNPKSDNALRIRKNLTLLLLEEARESARLAVANEASLIQLSTDDDTVAISTFKNLGSEDIKPLGKGMAAMLIYDLSLVPDLQVVERVKLQALVQEMKLGTSGLVTSETAPKVGKLLKAKHVTSGSLADLEKENLQIASAVMDTDQKANIGTQEAQGELKKFYELEKQIACQIIEDLGKECDKVPAAFHKNHTKSLPAVIFFSAGLDYLDQEKYDQAGETFQKALGEDPSFELAQQALLDTPVPGMQFTARSEDAAGDMGIGTTDEMITMAANHGVSASAAGTAISVGSTRSPIVIGGVEIGTTTAIIGGTAVVAGVAVAASGGSSSSSIRDDDGFTPSGTCDQQQVAGDDTADQRSIEMGQSSGTFNFYYETYGIEDQIIVSYEGNQLFDTGCVGASSTESLTYSGSSTKIRVEVIPNCTGTSGTAWNYIVNCP